jgi:hypothetical protein
MDRARPKRSIEGKLSHYSKKAPYFDAMINLVWQTFDLLSSDSLLHLNRNGLRAVCDYLRIQLYVT